MVSLRFKEISNIICGHIEQYDRELKIVIPVRVLQAGNDIARIHGRSCAFCSMSLSFLFFPLHSFFTLSENDWTLCRRC